MPRPPEWTQKEKRIMRKYYPTHGWRKVHELTGRSRYAIHCKAGSMGLAGSVGRAKRQYNARFSDDIVRQVRENRSGWTQARWAEELNCQQSAISKIQNRETYHYVL